MRYFSCQSYLESCYFDFYQEYALMFLSMEDEFRGVEWWWIIWIGQRNILCRETINMLLWRVFFPSSPRMLVKNTYFGLFLGDFSLLNFFGFCLYALIQTASDCCSPNQYLNKQLVLVIMLTFIIQIWIEVSMSNSLLFLLGLLAFTLKINLKLIKKMKVLRIIYTFN